jgi:carboxyl-terminal processing protease
MQLGDGSAVRLTVSRYYTPTGRSIQRAYIKGNDDYFDDYYKRINSGELMDETKIEVDDSLKFTTPKGKVVYGGGGIIPDVFVPLDKGMNNQTLEFIEKRGLISNFVFELLEKDRHYYSDFDENSFVLDLEIEDDVVEEFEVFLQDKTQSGIRFIAYKDEVKHYIKANIAEQLFGTSAYSRVLSGYDNMIKKVLSLEAEKLKE